MTYRSIQHASTIVTRVTHLSKLVDQDIKSLPAVLERTEKLSWQVDRDLHTVHFSIGPSLLIKQF